jgi:hypothetical protein
MKKRGFRSLGDAMDAISGASAAHEVLLGDIVEVPGRTASHR